MGFCVDQDEIGPTRRCRYALFTFAIPFWVGTIAFGLSTAKKTVRSEEHFHISSPFLKMTEDKPSRGREDKEPGTMKNSADNADDSISTQIQNTKAQVSGTWKKLSSTFQQAGQKVSNAFTGLKSKVSSKKTG